MEKRLYVGNLPYDITEDQLHDLFAVHGEVASTKLINDFNTGRSRGFGFVEMKTEEGAGQAIAQMNKAKVGNRELVVNEARPREQRSGGGNRGGFGGGRGGDFGGNRGGYGRDSYERAGRY